MDGRKLCLNENEQDEGQITGYFGENQINMFLHFLLNHVQLYLFSAQHDLKKNTKLPLNKNITYLFSLVKLV